ncbi:hypothetical protein EAI_11812 [Harpegnathos saltator]|uniref:Uncharacterized protein n=1 Tax=Harpegnathos saltator TaxID=610380 RepID=E2BQB8_HARSA|nr:hypothetical protein EAI_11812 [Harpegnathos saltator]
MEKVAGTTAGSGVRNSGGKQPQVRNANGEGDGSRCRFGRREKAAANSHRSGTQKAAGAVKDPGVWRRAHRAQCSAQEAQCPGA